MVPKPNTAWSLGSASWLAKLTELARKLSELARKLTAALSTGNLDDATGSIDDVRRSHPGTHWPSGILDLGIHQSSARQLMD